MELIASCICPGDELVRILSIPRWRPQLGAKPMNISISERELVIGQALIDMRGRKPA
jgi:hypothetical protein